MDAIRIGYVSAIAKKSGMVSVTYPGEDDATTDYLPFLAPGNEYFPPRIDDMVLVVYHSGSQGICLGTFWNKDNLPPFMDGAQKTYTNDSYIRYDEKEDAITISAGKDIVLKIGDDRLSVRDLIKGDE